MTLSKKQFSEYLSLYGSQIERWPQGLYERALPLASEPDYRALIEQERGFEGKLSLRHMESPSVDFAERIVLAARPVRQKSLQASLSRMQEFFEAVLLPRPAFALAAMLMVGVTVGLITPSQMGVGEEEVMLQSYLEDTGAML